LGKLKKDVPQSKNLKYFDKFSGDSAGWIDPYGLDYEKNAANLLLSGMIAFRQGNQQLAKARWLEAVNSEPDNPLAWKASLEAQGLGPFYRGFEIHRSLPERALLAGTSSAGSAAPPDTYGLDELWSRGTEFLLGMQRNDGAFVDTEYDFGGTDSLPNVYVAVTSLVGMSLLKAHERLPQQAVAIKRAIVKAEQYVTDESNLNHADRDEILWACAFRLRFLTRISQHAELKRLIPNLKEKRATAVNALENIQLKTGNWYHEYNNPFVTATALLALHEAKQAGSDVDGQKIERGIKSLLLDRRENGTYPYYSVRKKSKKPAKEKKSMLASSAGRMPVCELALVKWQQKKQVDLVAAVSNSLEQHRHLASAYKYDNHTSNMAYGGFFFWYDMRSRSEAIRSVDGPSKAKFWKRQQEIILNLPEVDGCFVDSHELGRCYGTAMAILSLE
ncbi:MAG: hypothetical protein VX438_06240, partial [Planctomycetota bacterium]|nr:hypothetical protein [Planctomycetota bacterium]